MPEVKYRLVKEPWEYKDEKTGEVKKGESIKLEISVPVQGLKDPLVTTTKIQAKGNSEKQIVQLAYESQDL